MSTPSGITGDGFAIVGNINLDIRTSPIPPSPDLFKDGETSVETIYESIGGGGGNVAQAVARLGGRVHFCGCVGDDALGERLEETLRSLGIFTHLRRKGKVTGYSINLVWNNYHRHFVSNLPNNRLLAAEDINVAALAAAGCRHLFRADPWFSESLLAGGNTLLFQQARKLGLETSLDINWDPEWSDGADSPRVHSRRKMLRETLSHVSWVHGNERELGLFTGLGDIKTSCRFLVDHGCGAVIIHRGERGAAAFTTREGWIEAPPAPVKSIVCETGSGDVFSAAFLLYSALPLSQRLEKCCWFASRHLQGSLDPTPVS